MMNIRLPYGLIFLILVCSAASPPRAQAPDVTPLQQLFLLKELKPDVKRVGILWNEASPNRESLMKEINRATAASQLDVVVRFVTSVKDVASGFRTLLRDHDIQALWIVENDGVVDQQVAQKYVIENATKQKIVVLAPTSDWVTAGACLSFKKEDGATRIVINQTVADVVSVSIPEKYAERTEFLTLN